MSIFDVDFGQSWSILLIFGLSILKLALRGLARAHWVAPLTSMPLRSQILTLGLWRDLNLNGKHRSVANTDIWAKYRLMVIILRFFRQSWGC